MSKSENNKKKILLESYMTLDLLGSGSFGEVYKASRRKTNTLVAMKIEKREKSSRLEHEYKIYKKLEKSNITNIPKIYDFIRTTEFNIMCMDLLGPCLEDLFSKNNKKFSLPTVMQLGKEIITMIKNIHSMKIIHRDIKPNNFLIGRDELSSKIYIMDFGLSKKYEDDNGTHMKFKEGRSLIGTARYASINMHMGIEPSRRDDLESVGYMLIYFANGILPWQGLKRKKNQNHIELIGEVKLSTSIKKLCGSLPQCIADYIVYCRNLRFSEIPDYDYLLNLFNVKHTVKYDWIDSDQKSSSFDELK